MNKYMISVVPEGYPRPQLVRSDWFCLNGDWEFAFDQGNSGIERGFQKENEYTHSIRVPYCPESSLSGIGYKDFMPAVWYRRKFELENLVAGRRWFLHFGAVDYFASVWVNGQLAGTHEGGYTPFSFDITALVAAGENTLVVCAQDEVRSKCQPSGKQSERFYSYGCFYTRVTGIWQTVWLEHVPDQYIERIWYYPDYENCSVAINIKTQNSIGCTLKAQIYYGGKLMGENSGLIEKDNSTLYIPLLERHGWMPGDPKLYEVALYINTKNGIADTVASYFGLRTVTLDDKCMCINGRRVFQRLVLDQGYYPDGIYTAPDDAAIIRDIELSLAMGFNGARLHEKVFEPRMLYWADCYGYLIWGEYGNWGLDITSAEILQSFLPQWFEAVERDFNHPAIIGWCPFNETWDEDIPTELDGTVDVHKGGRTQNNNVLRIVYDMTKRLDFTRPVIDTSGNYHVKTDIYDIHDYTQECDLFVERYQCFQEDPYDNFPKRQTYSGQPYMLSEFGGIWWNPENNDAALWGYGNRPVSEEDFIKRYRTMVNTLLQNPDICGFCYTQLYDVEQEVNGLYTYDRIAKFDPMLIYSITSRPAAIEQQKEEVLEHEC